MPDINRKADFDRDGFVVIRDFLPPDEFRDLTARLDHYIREIVPTLDDADAFYHDKSRPETLKQMQHMVHDPYFANFRENTRWSDVAAELIGEPVTADTPEWFNKPPGTEHPTPPHQDGYYFCLVPPHALTMWLAIDPVDEENGCLRFARGSHLRGVRNHARSQVLGFSQAITDYGADDESNEVAMIAQPNDLLVHHCYTIHRADANRSSRDRRAFACVYRGVSAQRDPVAYQQYQDNVKTQHETMGLET